MRTVPTLRSSFFTLASLVGSMVFAGCAAGGAESVESTSAPINTASIASIALANVGKGACSTNSAGGHAFDRSCTGNGGEPEYWCADFAMWVWGEAGADTSGLTAAAGSFYTYGEEHRTLHSTPAVGDAVVFDYHGGGVADHVAIVVRVLSNGTIETVSGDWNGDSGSEAHFASTSHVVHNAPAYEDRVGDQPGIMGMTISGFISPAGTGGSAGGCVVGGLYCGGDKVSGSSSTLYKCTGGSSGTVVEACSHGCEVNAGSDDACKSGGSTGGGGSSTGSGDCVAGGLYCGGDKVSGSSKTLYRCTSGSSGTALGTCSDGCEVLSGSNDECRGSGGCVEGGLYCGGDKVAGDPATLYRCTGGSSGSVHEACARGCSVNAGADDSCK